MRLNYIPDPPNFTDPSDQAVVERVKQRRGDKGLIALDKTLLHAPMDGELYHVLSQSINTECYETGILSSAPFAPKLRCLLQYERQLFVALRC
jgi:hypothetical protein